MSTAGAARSGGCGVRPLDPTVRADAAAARPAHSYTRFAHALGTGHRRILVRVRDQQPTSGEPKTKRSRRAVPLTPDVIDALRAHADRQDFDRRRLGDDYGRHGLVFATATGTPMAVTVVQTAYKRALARADLHATIRFHALRHAAASMMLRSGVDVPTVARVLGHARNSTTLDVYGHAVPSNLGSAVSAIQRAI